MEIRDLRAALIAVALTGLTALSACSSGASASDTLKVGVSPVPHAQILKYVADNLAASKGLKIEVVEFTDYVQPNTALVDGSLDAFPVLGAYSTVPSTGFVVVQGAKPAHAALNRDEAAPYPQSAVVSVKLDGPRRAKTRAPGLISGTVDYEAGDFCPAPVAMTHEELNKDKSTLVDRSQQHEAAKALAILQSEHEWCRLQALANAAWGASGAARLDAWVADGAVVPECGQLQ
jgi:hypothetical protein